MLYLPLFISFIASKLCCMLRGPCGESILDIVPRKDGARNSG